MNAISAIETEPPDVGGYDITAHLWIRWCGQTCKYMGLDFLDFLRSGEKDIHDFAESLRGRRRRTQTSQPTGLPAEAIPDGTRAGTGAS